MSEDSDGDGRSILAALCKLKFGGPMTIGVSLVTSDAWITLPLHIKLCIFP